MVSEITRGVKFRFSTELDPGAAKALEAIEKRVDALQKRMHLTLDVTERGGRGSGGTGRGSSSLDASAKAAEKAAQARERAAERSFRAEAKLNRMAEAAVAKREAAEKRAADRSEREAKRAADAEAREAARVTRERQRELDRQTKADKKFWDEAIQQARAGARARADAIADAAREDARGWRNLSTIGRESYVGNRKVAAGFDALSDMGRAAMPRDAFAEGLRKMEEAKAMRSGWSGLGAAGADAQQRLKNLRDIAKKDDDERKRALDSQKGQLREINSAAYDVVHAFGQLTRAAAQFGLVGQRDMMKVLDTIFAVEGGINALQGGMNAFRAIRSIREARAGMGPGAGAVKYAAGLARLGGTVAGTGATGTAAAGAGGIGLGTIGLAVAGVTALAAGGIGLLGTIADRRRGVPGQVGGFWDTVGTKLSSNSSRVTGYGLRAFGGLEAAFNSPYGLTSRERELRTEGVLERTANSGLGSLLFGATGQHALSEMRIGRQERFTSEEIERRGAMRERKEAEGRIRAPLEARLRASEYGLEAQRFGIRSSGLQARGAIQERLRGEAFERRQAARGEELELRQTRALGGYVSPVQEARAKREREIEEQRVSGFRKSRLENLDEQLKDAEGRKEKLGARYKSAREKYESIRPDATSIEGMTGPNVGSPEEVATAYREMQETSQAREKIEEDILRIKQEQRKVGVDGAREELQAHEKSLAAAKQLANSLRNEKQSDRERFGRLLPEQQAAVREAMQAASTGSANRLQIQRLEEFGFARKNVREYYEGKAAAGGFEGVYGQSGRDQELVSAEAEEKKSKGITDSARDTLAEKLQEEANQRARENADVILPLLEKALKFERDETNRLIQEGLDNYFRQNNQQGGVVWGNG